jgi:hypothetical protein
MKKKILFLLLFFSSYSFSQSINDYIAVIIPLKYDFQKSDNQYRLQTLTKINLKKAGFQAFYSNETFPSELSQRCSLLYIDLINESSLFVTKIHVVFKDCYGTEIFKSDIGRSNEKEYQLSYAEAINEAFKSVYGLHYKFSGKEGANIQENLPVVTPEASVLVSKNEPKKVKIIDDKSPNLLYAQPTAYGYQLIDCEPKVVMKVFKTSNPASFMASKGSVLGVLVSKDNQWFFEYYQNDQLISEKVEVKF